ncbi:hypothetical protein V1478_016918 [Vespula squamosa]|uniref:Uncharacterized protein n=1 Tax=Vespula squamosa TaxID=30214 RepID=A0ABD1ZXY1_VESSQ
MILNLKRKNIPIAKTADRTKFLQNVANPYWKYSLEIIFLHFPVVKLDFTVGTKNFQRSCGNVKEVNGYHEAQEDIFKHEKVKSSPGEDFSYPDDNYREEGLLCAFVCKVCKDSMDLLRHLGSTAISIVGAYLLFKPLTFSSWKINPLPALISV